MLSLYSISDTDCAIKLLLKLVLETFIFACAEVGQHQEARLPTLMYSSIMIVSDFSGFLSAQ